MSQTKAQLLERIDGLEAEVKSSQRISRANRNEADRTKAALETARAVSMQLGDRLGRAETEGQDLAQRFIAQGVQIQMFLSKIAEIQTAAAVYDELDAEIFTSAYSKGAKAAAGDVHARAQDVIARWNELQRQLEQTINPGPAFEPPTIEVPRFGPGSR